MPFIVYKTTNKINGKFYIGVHDRESISDSYLGSGKLLLKAIKKYGKHNFSKEILHSCITREDMYQIEAELVTQDLVSDSNCYNAKLGGFGGWSHWNNGNEKHREVCKVAGKSNLLQLIARNKSERCRKITTERNKIENINRKWINNGIINKFVKSSTLEHHLTTGWIQGRIKNNCKISRNINQKSE